MTDLKTQLRPEISSINKTENFSIEEEFQNEVLRPIIKLQNDLIFICFEYFLKLNKVKFSELNTSEKAGLIQKLFKVDMRLKSELRSLIIGLFTFQEYKDYLNHASKMNKRINSIIQKRVESFYL